MTGPESSSFVYDHEKFELYRISANFEELSELFPNEKQNVAWFGTCLHVLVSQFRKASPTFEIPGNYVQSSERDWQRLILQVCDILNKISDTARPTIITVADEALRDANEATKLVWELIKKNYAQNANTILETAIKTAREAEAQRVSDQNPNQKEQDATPIGPRTSFLRRFRQAVVESGGDMRNLLQLLLAVEVADFAVDHGFVDALIDALKEAFAGIASDI